ncbi:MAG: hypothetical protein LBP59_15085 [Planctomycetaceae bacterium]|jgi:hypothetical protein|nr:hypothetical protein [Planctomycetaceae bacterium]
MLKKDEVLETEVVDNNKNKSSIILSGFKFPADKNPKDYVWYVCYGSNLLYERFMLYIEGGRCRLNNEIYEGCNDTNQPLTSIPFTINYHFYYAKESPKWEDQGVAFIDDKKQGTTQGRAYLITKCQFEEVWCQEGRSANWYGLKVLLGIDENKVKYLTFTNEKRLDETLPSKTYKRIIKLGLKETNELKDAGKTKT